MVNRFASACAMLAVLFVVLIAAAPSGFAQWTTSNQYVAALVKPGNGLITIRLSPGTPQSPILSYPDKSFFSVMINGKVYTNNNVGTNLTTDPRFGGKLENGINRKVGDTIITTWPNINGCDVIQEVYPVELLASGQIVMRWKLKNLSANTPVFGQTQFLLDLQVGSQNPNDGAPILTRYGYRPIWEQYKPASQFGIPWFFAAFENQLPNSPTFETGITGVGYNQDVNYKLGLKKPLVMTLGDWGNLMGQYALVDFLWGASSSAPWGTEYKDAAILYEWGAVGVGGGKTEELARTSYGTGEFGICTGQLYGIVFYPRLFEWKQNKYVPDTATVEFYAFNTYSPLPTADNYGPASSGTHIKIHCGPNLRVVWPDTQTNVTKTTQRQQTDPVGYIPQYGVGTCTWRIVADRALDCVGQKDSWLKFHAESSLSGTGGIFVNSGDADTCEHHLLIDCVEEDFIAPIAENEKSLQGCPQQVKTFDIRDNRPKDKGLKEITWVVQPGSGTDAKHFNIELPNITNCPKGPLTVKVTQLDSAFGGCFDFTILDCVGNDTTYSICIPPCTVVNFVDTLPPQFTTIERTPGDPNVPCNGRCDSILVTDNRQIGTQVDVGLRRIEVCASDNMNVSALNVPIGAKLHSVKVCVIDTMKDGFVTICATDTLGNRSESTYSYCTIKDTIDPVIEIVSVKPGRGHWQITVSDTNPWDRGIRTISVFSSNNVNVILPANPGFLTTFDAWIIDSTKDASFCLQAEDSANFPAIGNISDVSCGNVNADSDKYCPNFTITPPLTPALTQITVTVDDYHTNPQGDTLGWDKGIDSIWFTNVRGIIVPPPRKLNCVKVSPSFTLSVEDTLNVDSLACATINASDCAGNVCTYQWCYPYNPDDMPPLLQVTFSDRSTFKAEVEDSRLYDRGVKILAMKGEDNFSPLDLSINRDPSFSIPFTRPKYSSSSFGTLEAIDYWGTLNVPASERDAHTASIDLGVWVQDLQMKRGEMVREPGTFELPIRFVANDTFSLIRKGIDEIEFTFTLSGDVGSVNFLGVRTTGVATDGWTFDPVVPNGNTYRIHGTKPAGGSSLFQVNGDTLLALQFSALENEFTKDVILTIDAVKCSTCTTGETVIYNNGADRIVTGQNAIATLPAPYGTLSGSHIVIVGSCAPSLETGSQPPSIVSLEQNSPNPFNGKTSFTFSVKEDGMVKLAVYDMLGKEVGTLVNMILAQGRYTVSFDGSKLSTGSYVARLVANGSVRSRMMRIDR